MRFSKACLFVASAIALCSCASEKFQTGSGDLGTFIVQKAKASGASTVSANAPLRVTGDWRYFQDRNGTVIRMEPVNYAALESFLIQTFGQPSVGPKDTPSGGKYGVYRLSPNGGVLQFGRDVQDGAHVEIIHALAPKDVGTTAAQVFSDLDAQKAPTKP